MPDRRYGWKKRFSVEFGKNGNLIDSGKPVELVDRELNHQTPNCWTSNSNTQLPFMVAVIDLFAIPMCAPSTEVVSDLRQTDDHLSSQFTRGGLVDCCRIGRAQTEAVDAAFDYISALKNLANECWQGLDSILLTTTYLS